MDNNLTMERQLIEDIDLQIIDLLKKRKIRSVAIGKLKKQEQMPIHDEERRLYSRSMWGEFSTIYDLLHDLSKSYQE
jgi:chorismate mutase